MRHRNIKGFLFLLVLFMLSADVYAQALIKDRSDIVGAWKLELTAPNLEKTKTNKETSIWDFHPDGTVIISGYNRYLDQDTRFEKSYEIEVKEEAAIIKIKDNVRTTEYKVVKKTADEMILEGTFGYYFFKKK